MMMQLGDSTGVLRTNEKRLLVGGRSVCTVTIRQPRDIVEGAIVRHLLDQVLTAEVIEQITARVAELAQQEQGQEAVPVAKLQQELDRLRQEQKRLVKHMAALDDTGGELAAQHAARSARIRDLENALAAAKSVPTTVELIKGQVSATIDRLRQGLVGAPDDLRAALRALFNRLIFEADGNHWAVSGTPRIEMPETSAACATPAGHSRSGTGASLRNHGGGSCPFDS